MSNIIINIVVGAVGLILGVVVSILFLNKTKFFDLDKRKAQAEDLIEESKKTSAQILHETTQQASNLKTRMEEEAKKRQERIEKIKESLNNKEKNLFRKEDRLNETRLKAAAYKEETQSLENSIQRAEKNLMEKLTATTGQSTEDVKTQILNRYKSDLEGQAAKKLAIDEDIFKENAPKLARGILVNIVQRLSSPTSVESRAVLIKVPQDHMKGKIVGKNAENIEEFEKALDVAIVFNDLPNTISLSSHNLVARRVAEKALKKLIKTRGSITPKTIKEAIHAAKKQMHEELFEVGRNALQKMGIKSDDKPFIKTVGRLQYRTSYGQNIMKHSMEVGWIASMLGGELKADKETCKIAGFLHDLGKAIDQDPDVTDAHDKLTKELMEKFGFPEKAIHAAWAHHDAVPQETAEALLVKAADAISGGRPGARQDTLERYIERIQAINDTVNSFEGVKKSYTMSAGREVRINVDPDKVTDQELEEMAKNVASKIEENVTYPGKIRIKTIRRTKSLETAK